MYAIICIGDSITYGVGELPCKGWVGRLKDTLEKNHRFVYNLGIPGDTAEGIMSRLEAELCRNQLRRNGDKSLVILNSGMNDSRKSDGKPIFTDEEYKNNLITIFEILNKKMCHLSLYQQPMLMNL